VEAVFNHLGQWLAAIAEEENIDPQLDANLLKLKEEFFRNLGNHVKDENNHFTREEADELTKRIDRLEEALEKFAKDNKKSDAEIAKIKKTMGDAKQEVGTLPKNKWLRVGGGKILNALFSFGRTKEGQKLIGEVTERLLGPGSGH
jgi:hypothetical protein